VEEASDGLAREVVADLRLGLLWRLVEHHLVQVPQRALTAAVVRRALGAVLLVLRDGMTYVALLPAEVRVSGVVADRAVDDSLPVALHRLIPDTFHLRRGAAGRADRASVAFCDVV
jgi:hypothetical protein